MLQMCLDFLFAVSCGFEVAFSSGRYDQRGADSNAALHKPAVLSSTTNAEYSRASFATDGETVMDNVLKGGCAETTAEVAGDRLRRRMMRASPD